MRQRDVVSTKAKVGRLRFADVNAVCSFILSDYSSAGFTRTITQAASLNILPTRRRRGVVRRGAPRSRR